MNEEIFAAVVRGDKPETLVAVEPFHNPGLLANNRSCIFRHRRDGKTPTEEEPPLKPVLSPQPTSAGPQNFLVALFSAFVSLSLSLSLQSSHQHHSDIGIRDAAAFRSEEKLQQPRCKASVLLARLLAGWYAVLVARRTRDGSELTIGRRAATVPTSTLPMRRRH